ncbi:MAG: imidazoleglycerol-phosphate dehydratase HisB [Candidatus Omnitrophica bacterium]|nr:imidazoleglycerol-phosphate dehydratase HisB [Candidatus Omnitrophota bacterium]
MAKRTSEISRKTKETDIKGSLNIDGKGEADVKTGIGFLDHMLDLFAFHGLFDLTLKAKGDLEVDMHHTNEDVGISLGLAFKKALGNCRGIKRFGASEVPMDKARAKVVVDISNRYAFEKLLLPGLAFPALGAEEGYTFEDGMDFLDSFAKKLGMNLHVEVSSGSDLHHVLEAVFKAFGIAMDQATQIDARRKDIPSTKGVIADE